MTHLLLVILLDTKWVNFWTPAYYPCTDECTGTLGFTFNVCHTPRLLSNTAFVLCTMHKYWWSETVGIENWWNRMNTFLLIYDCMNVSIPTVSPSHPPPWGLVGSGLAEHVTGVSRCRTPREKGWVGKRSLFGFCIRCTVFKAAVFSAHDPPIVMHRGLHHRGGQIAI